MEVVEYMKSQDVCPDLYSYNTIMNICAKSAKTCARVPGGPSGEAVWGLDQGLSILQSLSEDGVEADVGQLSFVAVDVASVGLVACEGRGSRRDAS